MYVQKSNKMFYALLVAITVQSLGLLILTSLGIIEVPTHTFPVLGTIIGSFIFGVGSISWWLCHRYVVELYLIKSKYNQVPKVVLSPL